MTFKTEIRGMTFFRGSAPKSGVRRLALAEVFIPEMDMTIRGVQLTWTPGKGYGAQSPSATIHGAVYAIGWNLKAAFARDLADKLVRMFEAMGGELPGPARRDPMEAAKSGEEIERRTFPFTLVSIDGKPVGDEVDADDSTGLHRVLGVDTAVAEACERAGL